MKSGTGSNPRELTDRQAREKAVYDSRAESEWRDTVDLDYYSRDRFGPWNPYWRTFHYALENYPPPDNRLLAYGCGFGAQALRFANHGFHVTGFDISDGAIENAKSLAQKYELDDRCDFSVQTAEKLPYQDNSFDIVVGTNILHHISLDKAIPELARVVRPGGAAVFKDSVATPIRDRIRRSWIVRKLLPVGVKNKRTGEKYRTTVDEVPLSRADFKFMREHFSRVDIERFHVLALLGKVFGNRTTMEKLDWRLFRIIPFLRRLGDNVVVVLRK